MDQIREQVTRVLDKQGVLSRLKAELRANVFLAINDQDIRQGGVGLGSKSDATHRQLLTAEPSGVLLLELVREFMQWSNLQFTQQVYEQEMQLGPAAPLDLLQQQMGPLVNADVDQPLLLQLLNQVTDSSSSNWHAAAAKADPPHQRSSRAAGNQTATAAAGSRHSMSLPRQQLRDGSAAAPEAAPVPVEAKASAGQLETDVCNAASAASKLPSKSTSLLGTASVAEDSSLIGTQLAEEDTSQEYATVLLPKHHTSSSAGLDDEASSASSTYPVDTPRITARPVTAQAAAAAGSAQQAQVSTLRPAGQHAPLPPLAARPAPAEPPAAPIYTAAEQGGSNGDYGMAGACELTDSFGHDRSFGDSSLELQGLDSPPHGAAVGARAAAARAMDAEASYSSRSSSSGDGSSRALSPAEGDLVPGAELQQPAAAVQEQRLPAVRAPGKLTPLPPVGSGSGSTSGLSKHHSEGLRDELLRAGLLGPQAPAAPAADAAQQQLEAEGSAGSLASDRDSKAPAAAGMGGSMSDDSQASSNVTDSQEFPSWHGKVAAARLSGADRQQQQGGGSTQHAGSMGRELSQGEGDGSDDDSGARGRQQLLEAARRQLSNSSRSRSSSQGLGQQQQQQQRAGEMQVEVSGAELTLTSSGELDDDMIPEDISLPIDALMDGSEYSGLFEPAQHAGPPAGGQSNAWASSARAGAGAGAAGAAAPAGSGSRGMRQQAAQPALELTDEEDSDGASDREQPLAAAGGFSIDDDDF